MTVARRHLQNAWCGPGGNKLKAKNYSTEVIFGLLRGAVVYPKIIIRYQLLASSNQALTGTTGAIAQLLSDIPYTS